jgi:hypothetical protein
VSLRWPGFLRRRALLDRARAALLRDDLRAALDALADRALRGEPEAAELAARALELLVARTEERAGEGRGGERADEALVLLARHAPERALALQRDLVRRAEGAASRETLSSVLGELRSRSRVPRVEPPARVEENRAAVVEHEGRRDEDGAADARSSADGAAPATLFHLAIDDGGEFLAAVGTRLVIGHLRSHAADLPLLADIEPSHAELRAATSFHGGLRWRLVPLVDDARLASMSWRGRVLPREGVELAHGDRVQLARNLALRVVAPDAASSSSILELEHGLECHGATRILLFAPGPAGRVRLGRKRTRLIPIADLEHDVSLELEPGRLVCACAGGLRDDERVIPAAADARLALAFPPERATCVVVGARRAPSPPFQIRVRPLDPPLGAVR